MSRRAPASPPLGPELLRQQLAELTATSTPSDVALLVRRHPALLAPQAIGAATADSEALGWRVDGLRQVAGSGAAGGLPLSPGRRVRVRNPLAMARHAELVDRFVLLHERGRVEDAAPRAPEVVELAREAYGEQSTEYGVQLLNAAVVHAADQDWAAADRTFSAATDVLVADHPALLPGAAASIANAMAGAGQPADAMALYEFAWQLATRLPGQLDAVALSRVFRGIEDALVAAGDPARAETVLTPAIQDPVLLADNAQDFLAPVLTSLAEAVFKQERPAEAVALCRRALEVSQQAHGELHPAVARLMRGLGRTLRSAGVLPEALVWARRGADVWRSSATPDELAWTLSSRKSWPRCRSNSATG